MKLSVLSFAVVLAASTAQAGPVAAKTLSCTVNDTIAYAQGPTEDHDLPQIEMKLVSNGDARFPRLEASQEVSSFDGKYKIFVAGIQPLPGDWMKFNLVNATITDTETNATVTQDLEALKVRKKHVSSLSLQVISNNGFASPTKPVRFLRVNCELK